MHLQKLTRCTHINTAGQLTPYIYGRILWLAEKVAHLTLSEYIIPRSQRKYVEEHFHHMPRQIFGSG